MNNFLKYHVSLFHLHGILSELNLYDMKTWKKNIDLIGISPWEKVAMD